MKKRFFCFLMVIMLSLQFFLIPAVATDDPVDGDPPAGTPTEAPAPSETTQPSEPVSTESTTTTEPSVPASCTTHTYGDWTSNEGSHSHKCNVCGHVESNSHTWAAETVTVVPTCKDGGGSAKVCTVCQLILITELVPPLTTHTYDNTCDDTCNICGGGKREVTHTFGKTWTYSGKGHWNTCTVCGAAGELKEHYPGPAATEEKDQICLTCGMVMMKKKPHTHKWDTKWSSDANEHWYVCTVCQEKDKTAFHTYDGDCDTDCNDCGYVRTAAHAYGPEWGQTESTHYGICTVCGENGSEENHISDSSGTSCSVCGYAMEAVTEPHEHTFVKDVWEFDEYGHWNTCVCGEKDSTEPHSWNKGKEKGKQVVYTCEDCGAEKTEKAPEKVFPWLLIVAGGGVLICLVGIVVCVVVIIKNREYEDE